MKFWNERETSLHIFCQLFSSWLGKKSRNILILSNRISVNEDDQCEVVLVVDVEYWETNPMFTNDDESDEDSFSVEQRNHFKSAIEDNEHSINQAFYSYENELKKGFVSKF